MSPGNRSSPSSLWISNRFVTMPNACGSMKNSESSRLTTIGLICPAYTSSRVEEIKQVCGKPSTLAKQAIYLIVFPVTKSGLRRYPVVHLTSTFG